jgi:hypothetical protein
MLSSIRPRYSAAMMETAMPQRPIWKRPSGTQPRDRATIAPITVIRNDR